jgi:hypothetical protein
MNLSHVCRCPGRASNREPPECRYTERLGDAAASGSDYAMVNNELGRTWKEVVCAVFSFALRN